MKPLLDKNDHIFIAGHKGMVGNAISERLADRNYLNLLKVSRQEVNLEEINEVEELFNHKKPNVVIIAAAKVGGIYANNTYPSDFLIKNLKIQNNLIEISKKNNVKRLLFLGSSCIYPKFAQQPIKEEYLLKSSLEKTNEWYAIAKIAGIKLCEAMKLQYGLDAISLMPTNVYGPRDNYHPQNSHVIAGLIRKFYEADKNNNSSVTCWGSGEPLREFIHVNDLADACIFALENWDPSAKTSPKDEDGNLLTYLNVGTGDEISIKDLAHLIASKIGFQGKIGWDKSMPDGTPRKLLDSSKINKLGWKRKISLSKGIEETIDSYKKQIKFGSLRSY